MIDYEGFTRAVIDHFFPKDDPFGESELHYDQFLQLGEAHGVVGKAVYDPDVHGEMEAEPGEEIYVSVLPPKPDPVPET